jgi:hypothetical protein
MPTFQIKLNEVLDIVSVPDHVLDSMRDWLKDCEFREGFDSHIDVEDARDIVIIAAVNRHYDGGYKAFLNDYYL